MSDAGSILKYQTDGVLHIKEVQGVETLHDYQIKKIISPIYLHDRVAIRACHDVGKTYSLAKIVLALGSSFPGCKIITTAPSWSQVEKLLWSEIRSGHRKSKIKLGGRMLTTEWKIEDDWFVVGLSPKDEGEGDGNTQGTTSNFQGYHARLVVVVFDEATGISAKRWIQAEGMLTSQHVKFIAIGNPTSKASTFYQCFKDPAWYKSHISCFDSPNLIANNFTDLQSIEREVSFLRTLSDVQAQEHINSYKCTYPYLLTAKWVVSLAFRRGVNHPLFQGKALGEFPDEDEHVLISLGMVEAAQRREYLVKDSDPRFYGIDVARKGADDTVITTIDGWKTSNKKVISKMDGEEVVGEFIALVNSMPRRKSESVLVDGTGVGSSVVDFIKVAIREGTLPKYMILHDIQFGSGFEREDDKDQKLEDKKLYANKKAKMYDCLAEDMKEDLCIPPDSIYQEELTGIRYKFDGKGRYIIESKDDYKKRTSLGSPDHGDSLALANFGRHVSGEVGTFAEHMKKAANNSATIAPGLRSGDQW